MNRRRPLRRTTPLDRSSRPLERRTPLGRGKPIERLLSTNPSRRREERTYPGANGWTQRVFSLYGRRCVVCRRRPAAQGHHAIAKQTLIARGERELVYDARNGVPVCFDCHQAHENASRRIPFACLPAGVVEWALDYGFRWYLERFYPGTPR